MNGRAAQLLAAPLLAVALLFLDAALTGCGEIAAGAPGSGAIRVVAAENFWGSIARQIGGRDAVVQSIIVNPAQDPHSYEPTPNDARAMATAQLAIVNGVGYDPWAPQLLAANPVDSRIVLTVGSLFGLHGGANPHRWYDPAEVEAVARAIAARLTRLDPKHASYYGEQLNAFLTQGLARYHALIGEIHRRYAGLPVGASESVFALQAPALGLHLVTPPRFMKAISEGTEVTAQDTATAQRQISTRQIKLWVFNSQNVTPEIQRLNGVARQAGTPVATITETLSPATGSFEQWQVRQLQGIAAGLHQATGR